MTGIGKSLYEILGSSFSLMPGLREGVKVRQVSTHTHNAMPVFPKFREIGHMDFKIIPATRSYEFPPITGPGCIGAIWITFAGSRREIFMRRRVPAQKYLWIKIYFDGADTAQVEAPVGDFFGNGTSYHPHYQSRFLGMSSGGYYCYFPMPFKKSCRIVMENRHRERHVLAFYGAVTFAQLPEFPENTGIFHARYSRGEFSGSPDVSGSRVPNHPHIILDETGIGHYVGTTLTIKPTHWLRSRYKPPYFLFPYLEGNLKVYVDGEWPASEDKIMDKPVGSGRGGQSIEYTGVEDYFNSGWYYAKGRFSAEYHGCPVKKYFSGVVSQYRFHETDAFTWKENIRITVTHGEFDNIDCIMESVAYYYKSP